MDMEGYVVKTVAGHPGWAPQIQEDGTIWSGGYIHDWDGNVIWSYTTAPVQAHHAWRKMWNKKLNKWTMLVLCNSERDPGRDRGQGLGSQHHAIRRPSRRV